MTAIALATAFGIHSGEGLVTREELQKLDEKAHVSMPESSAVRVKFKDQADISKIDDRFLKKFQTELSQVRGPAPDEVTFKIRAEVESQIRDRAVSQVRRIGVKRNQDWTQHQITFNSLDHRELTIWFGVWQHAKGSLEWRNWKIEALGPHDVLRRDGAPVVLEGAVEGRDVSAFVDTLLGNSPCRRSSTAFSKRPTMASSPPSSEKSPSGCAAP